MFDSLLCCLLSLIKDVNATLGCFAHFLYPLSFHHYWSCLNNYSFLFGSHVVLSSGGGLHGESTTKCSDLFFDNIFSVFLLLSLEGTKV